MPVGEIVLVVTEHAADVAKFVNFIPRYVSTLGLLYSLLKERSLLLLH